MSLAMRIITREPAGSPSERSPATRRRTARSTSAKVMLVAASPSPTTVMATWSGRIWALSARQ